MKKRRRNASQKDEDVEEEMKKRRRNASQTTFCA